MLATLRLWKANSLGGLIPYLGYAESATGGLRRTKAYCGMSKKVRIVFKFKRIDEGNWQIEAHGGPDTEVRYVTGFKDKAEVDAWLNGTKRIDWLRSQGLAK